MEDFLQVLHHDVNLCRQGILLPKSRDILGRLFSCLFFHNIDIYELLKRYQDGTLRGLFRCSPDKVNVTSYLKSILSFCIPENNIEEGTIRYTQSTECVHQMVAYYPNGKVRIKNKELSGVKVIGGVRTLSFPDVDDCSLWVVFNCMATFNRPFLRIVNESEWSEDIIYMNFYCSAMPSVRKPKTDQPVEREE